VTPQIALDTSPLRNLVGSSAAMKQVHRLVARMSKSRYPVLILGETGTGKEVVAQAIHNLESQGRFVVVDCSSMVGPLMESNLFGHRKGSYTGAIADKLGLLDEANGGTAFFDEIGELPLELQMKLLRVLQEKEFRAIGGNATRSSNFRVIAATNRDLEVEVTEKRFRQDLYYRLNVMKLRLPALRDRKEDIPVLIAHFLQRHGNGHKVPDEVMDLLCEYDWPGNVRELEHTVQRLVAMNTGPWLTIADLPSALVNHRWEREQTGRATAEEEAAKLTSDRESSVIPLDEVEKRAILKAIQITKGDRTLAAQALGIGRTTLYRKLKEYGM
jgi:transcriptional regulator with PAS, ATPase and Fis domain